MQVAFACATVRCLRLDHEGKRELGKFDDLFHIITGVCCIFRHLPCVVLFRISLPGILSLSGSLESDIMACTYIQNSQVRMRWHIMILLLTMCFNTLSEPYLISTHEFFSLTGIIVHINQEIPLEAPRIYPLADHGIRERWVDHTFYACSES